MTELSQVQIAAQAIQQNIGKVIVGKSSVVELLTVALLTLGHVLIEDVPGLAKTMLAKSLALNRWAARFSACSSHPICCPVTLPASASSIRRRKSLNIAPGR